MKKQILPVVRRMKNNIDALFLRYVGPIGETLADEEFDTWLENSSTGPSGLLNYIQLLSQHIPDQTKRREFSDEASGLIRIR